MKILAIRVKNLASLEGVFEIDFTKEPLKSAGIFAITGSTGAGKSTLLDALCLALFSKTPRHIQAKESGIELQDGISGKISQGDVRGILRKGSPDGYAEVEFIGLDGIRYQATWSVRRSRNKAEGSLQPDTMELINKSTNSKFPEKKTGILKEIERLVGLNFEQFSRSVLLAQGDFTAFLKADKDEKSSLLEKLTGTDIYSSISKLIYEKFKQAEQELKDLQKQAEGIILLSGEELQLYHQQQEELKKKISGLETEKNLLVTEITWFQVLKGLMEDKENAERIWHHAENEKKEAEARINYFLLVESVQDCKGLFESRTEIRNLEQQKTRQLSELLLHTGQLNDQLAIALSKLEAADSAVLQRETEYKAAIPDIEKAKVSDTLIKEKKDQLLTIKEEWQQAEQKKQQHLLKVQQKEKEIQVLSDRLSTLVQWKNENSSRQPVADHIILISSKLEDLGQLLDTQKTITGKITSSQLQHNRITTIIQTLEKETAAELTRRQELMTALEVKNNRLAAISIGDIKNKLTVFSPELEKTILTKGCWEWLYTAMQDQDNLLLKLEDCQKKQAALNEALPLQNNNLREALLKREQAQKLLSLARLENDKDVENMRTQLAEGDPCPVCGSPHHPYAGNNRQLQDLLEGITNEFKACNDNYENLVKENSRLTQLGVSLNQEKMNLEKDRVALTGKIRELTRKWDALEPDKRCTDLPPAGRLSWLEEAIIHLKNDIQTLRDQEHHYDQLKLTVDQQKKETEALDKILTEVRDHLKDARRDLITSGNDLVRLKAELKQNGDSIDGIRQTLHPFFTHTDWFINWQQDPVSFHQKIKLFAGEWNQKMQLLESANTQSGLFNTELQGLKGQLEGLDTETKNIQAKLTDLEKNYSLLLQQRKMLFNGATILSVEQQFTQAIEQAQLTQTTRKSEKEQMEAELTKSKAMEEQLKKDILSFTAQAEGRSLQIREWLQQYNSHNSSLLEEETLAGLLDHTPVWIMGERKYHTQLEAAITKSKATYEERHWQLSIHLQKKLSDRSPEETQEKLSNLDTVLDAAIHENNEIDFRLRQDADRKKQVGTLLAEIEARNTVYENWQKLNDLIGSADGKKFRQIAQEYTLDALLGYANIHLEVLSSRYQLSRVPGSLALQIIDKDMGDEIRSVHSLSGGESFLVSLALALGLASLSSSRMKVESLFIDEGFGSLDPATLSTAMDALERLHNQGRKVGVISHVQEMTERIPTQIKVLKLPNGKSKVEVTGI